MAHTIKGVEVFATGTWNKQKFTEADLDAAVHGYEATRGFHRAPVKLGHSAKQILAQGDGQPALGWMENIRRVGRKLVADLVGVPEQVYQALKERRYSTVSAEFFVDVPLGKERLKLVPKALALLGADLPAVTDLAGLETYLHSAQADLTKAATASFMLDEAEFSTAKHEENMDKAELTAAIAAAIEPLNKQHQQAIDGLEKKFSSAIEAKDKELEALRKEQGAAAERARVAEFKSQADKLKDGFEAKVKAGLITPALRDEVFKSIDGQEKTFTAGGQVAVSAELLGKMLEAISAKRPDGVASRAVNREFAAADPGAMLDAKAKAFMAQHKGTDYGAALEAVMVDPANAALVTQYSASADAAEANARKGGE